MHLSYFSNPIIISFNTSYAIPYSNKTILFLMLLYNISEIEHQFFISNHKFFSKFIKRTKSKILKEKVFSTHLIIWMDTTIDPFEYIHNNSIYVTENHKKTICTSCREKIYRDDVMVSNNQYN